MSARAPFTPFASDDEIVLPPVASGDCMANVLSHFLSIVVVGASGDLAKKKTYPALFALFCQDLLNPTCTQIVGYARSEMALDAFRSKIKEKLSSATTYIPSKVDAFLQICAYHAGQYGSDADWAALSQRLDAEEAGPLKTGKCCNRLFYFAIPPSVFLEVAKPLRGSAFGANGNGWNRVVVEKPFGKDSASSLVLSNGLSSLFAEDQVYRIDHYLGKEMVQNLMVLRFANGAFMHLWNRHAIESVQITFKEDIGTQGRGGYFDEFGIIRDVAQNHLMQILSLVAMESPVSLSPEDIRDEKVKVIRCMEPIDFNNVVLGQYVRADVGGEPGYLEDPGVPKDSVTPTFATMILKIRNERWDGVPFILKCGKALNERKAEIRLQFRQMAGNIYGNSNRNELVIRVQPNEAVYMKMQTKVPGLDIKTTGAELDLTWNDRFDHGGKLPEAYERLILDVIRGDRQHFVRSDELAAAWNLFTPLLHYLERERIKPIEYKFGSRGPAESDELIRNYGYVRSTNYKWTPKGPKL